MIGTLAWKEYREQRPVWLAMAVLGGVLLVGLLQVLDPASMRPSQRDQVLGGIAVAVAFTYGLVCGAMMLAGERESRTLPFLDYLEGHRARIWSTKALTGAILTLAQALLLGGVATGLAGSQARDILEGWFSMAAAGGLAGFAWGLLGSALCSSVLAAVGVAAVLLLFMAPFVMVIGQAISRHHDPAVALIVGSAAITVAALFGSGLMFCRPDWQRRAGGSKLAGRARVVAPSGVWAILWLTYRQAWVGTLVLAGVGLVLGAFVPVSWLLLWPTGTLLLGVGCGMGVFAGEQAGDAQRFLGDQRLPPARIWLVKTICWVAIAVALATLTFFLAASHYFASGEARMSAAGKVHVGERLIGQEAPFVELLQHIGFGTFLVLGLAYGFGFGQFFGVLTRKNAVAIVLAIVVSIVVAALWVPSLLAGGVRLWQVLVVPALLLATTRLVLWAWACGRLHTPRPLLILASGGALAAAWMAGNFWYRAVEIPDVGEPFDVRAFTASLPTPQQNEAGRLIRRAAEALEQYEKKVDAEIRPVVMPHGEAPLPEGQPNVPDEARRVYSDQIWDLHEKGWPKDSAGLGHWLDRMFEGEWAALFDEAARLPLGMVVDLRSANSHTVIGHVQQCQHAAALFTAQALQRQAQGLEKAALYDFGVALGLSRQLLHKTASFPYGFGISTQNTALSGMERWLQQVGPRPELLRAALNELNRHEGLLPPLGDTVKVDYLLLLNDRANLAVLLAGMRGRNARFLPEFQLVALASKVPWEEERETRLLRIIAASRLREVDSPPWEEAARSDLPAILRLPINGADLPFLMVFAYDHGFSSLWGSQERRRDTRSLCQLRATRLLIALALYAVEKGRPATKLEDLVPYWLAALPVDPYSGQSFHYRISKGEKIFKVDAGPEGPVSLTVPGQGIVWSVGPDHKDNGGTRDGSSTSFDPSVWSANHTDWIFLVPRWDRKVQR